MAMRATSSQRTSLRHRARPWATCSLDAPSGLLQSYVLVPTRQRLTALLAFVRSRFAEASAASGGSNGGGGGGGSGDCKMIIFVSSCDEVDFLYELLSVAGEWPNLKEAMKAAGRGDGTRSGSW